MKLSSIVIVLMLLILAYNAATHFPKLLQFATIMNTDKRNYLILSFICGFFAILTAFICIKMCLNISNAKNWVEASCVIDDIKVSGSKSKNVVLQYHYAFNDQDFTGQRYNFGDRLNYSRNKEYINKNLLGNTMPCYVNPDKPSYSVLRKNFEPNVTRDVIDYGFVSLLLMIACVICFRKSRS